MGDVRTSEWRSVDSDIDKKTTVRWVMLERVSDVV